MMKFKPQPWTHHHAHRLFHLSLGLCFAFIAGTLLSGIATAWWQVTASENLAIIAQVGDVEPGPVIISPSGGSVPAPPPTPPPAQPTVTIFPASPGVTRQPINTPQGPVTMFVFNTRQPAFAGTTNIPAALLFLEIHADTITYGTAQAGSDGQWLWLSPEDISPGVRRIFVTARSPNAPAVTATASLDFYVSPATPAEQLKPIIPPGTSGLKNLIGLFLSIPENYKRVVAGGKVVASLRLVSGDSQEPKDITYSLVGPESDIVFEQTETLPGSKDLAFQKSFSIHPSARSGAYTIKAKVSYSASVAVAADTFEVIANPAGAAAPRGIFITPLILQFLAGLLLLFMLLTFIAYREVRSLTHIIRSHQPTPKDQGPTPSR